MSAHVLVDDLADGQHILGDLRQLLRERFGIEHATLQLESERSPLVQIGRAPAGTPDATSPEHDARNPTVQNHGSADPGPDRREGA